VALKPEPARLTSVFGIVLAVVAILAIMAWTERHWAAPGSPTTAVYQPQHLILY
jgi:hypothetical protein